MPVDRLSLPDASAVRALSTRGDLDGLGWFASASDIEPLPAPRPCHGGPGGARGDQRGAHTAGAPLKSGFQTSQRSCASMINFSYPASRPMKSDPTRHFGTS
jgi:hypothetical protein